LEKGIKMGEKSRKGVRKVSFAKKNFFMSTDGTFHARALLERGWNKAWGKKKRGLLFFFQPAMCCHPTLVFINYAEMRFDSLHSVEGLVNSQFCYKLF
jgi:hypothetical protein